MRESENHYWCYCFPVHRYIQIHNSNGMHHYDESHRPETNLPCRPAQRKLSVPDGIHRSHQCQPAGIGNPIIPALPLLFSHDAAAIRSYPRYRYSHPRRPSYLHESGVDESQYALAFIFPAYILKNKNISIRSHGYKKETGLTVI